MLQANERKRDARTEDLAAQAVRERYSVDELQAIATLRSRRGFPGIPPDQLTGSEHDRAVVGDAAMRSLVARGVVDSKGIAPVPPHLTLFTVVLEAAVTCSVQRHQPCEIAARNAFLLEGLMVDQHSPAPYVVELSAQDADGFGAWLSGATGWSPAARMHNRLHQITRSVQKLRSVFGAVAAGVPTTLEDQRVLDSGRVLTSRRLADGARSVDLGWITTVETVWVFPNAAEVLGGLGSATGQVTLQATTESELTRAVARSVRPAAMAR